MPNAALRFRPTPEIFAALGITPPQPASGGGAARRPADVEHQVRKVRGAHRVRSGSQGAQGAQTARGGEVAPIAPRAPAAPAKRLPLAKAVRERPCRSPRRMAERMQNMTPEQREQMMARMRGRGGEGGRGADAGATTGRRGQGAGTAAEPPAVGDGPRERNHDRRAVRAAAVSRNARPGLGLRRQAAEARSSPPRHHRRPDDRAARRRSAAGHRAGHERHHRHRNCPDAAGVRRIPAVHGPGGRGGDRGAGRAAIAAAAAAAIAAAAAVASGTQLRSKL